MVHTFFNSTIFNVKCHVKDIFKPELDTCVKIIIKKVLLMGNWILPLFSLYKAYILFYLFASHKSLWIMPKKFSMIFLIIGFLCPLYLLINTFFYNLANAVLLLLFLFCLDWNAHWTKSLLLSFIGMTSAKPVPNKY